MRERERERESCFSPTPASCSSLVEKERKERRKDREVKRKEKREEREKREKLYSLLHSIFQNSIDPRSSIDLSGCKTKRNAPAFSSSSLSSALFPFAGKQARGRLLVGASVLCQRLHPEAARSSS